jgi:enoyl-CoA hydratase
MNSDKTFRALRLDVTGPVAEITLLGPGKGNALGPDFWREMIDVMRDLDRDPAVRVAILRGDGDHFTYGLDLKAMTGELGPLVAGAPLARERTRLLALIGELQQAVEAVAHARVPVIAAIHGCCIGGGVDLAAACDVRLAAEGARFSVREVKVAMVADLGSLQRLPLLIGAGHARELALTGKDIDAARALRIGLVNDVYPTKEALFDAARAMAREIAENPPLVVEGIKAVMNATQGRPVEEGLRHVALYNAAFLPSKDLGEAIGAFAERRPPKFEGR